MSVLFWFRKGIPVDDKDNPGGTLQVRVTINAQREEFGSTHIDCRRSQWDQDNQKMKGQTIWAQEQTQKLSKLKQRIEKLAEDLERDNHDVTTALVKDFFRLQHRPVAPGKTAPAVQHHRTVFSFIELCELHQSKQEKRKQRGKLSQATIDIQSNYAANIGDYLKLIKRDKLPATSLNEDLLDNLSIHLSEVEGFADSHLEKHLKFIKQVMSWASDSERKLIQRNPVATYQIESSEEEPDTTHLTIVQLQHLIDFNFFALSDDGKIHPDSATALDRERDAFVFNCFTGMHHVDYVSQKYRIDVDTMGHWIVGKRKKTEGEFHIKLLEPGIRIYQKYGEVLANLPIKSNQKRNDSLKLIAAYADIPLNLSTKIARKTFADIALNEMIVPEEDVAAMLGLKSTARLRHYVRRRRNRLNQLVSSWEAVSRVA